MSKLPELLGHAVGVLLMTFLVAAVVISMLSLTIGWLVPIATNGAVHIEFIQGIAVLTLGLIARILLFAKS